MAEKSKDEQRIREKKRNCEEEETRYRIKYF